MDPISSRIFLGAAGLDSLPGIGTAFEGGYFAGLISHTANGIPTHGLIVAPRATGYANLQVKTSNELTPNTTSPFDGAANTAAMIAAGAFAHPAAQFCDNLTIGGFSDWYLPARYELDIAYFNLKPTTSNNSTYWGINDYSVPKRTTNYSADTPARTSIAAFRSGGGEDFIVDLHWTSTWSTDSTPPWFIYTDDGFQNTQFGATNTFRVRAFRKFAL